jgi:hypothetical protein
MTFEAEEDVMRKIVTTFTVAAALAVVTAPAVAQVGDPVRERPAFGQRAGPGAAMARNPAVAVLEHREALGLTAEQVRQIEAIQARVQQENAPRLEQLRAAFAERAVPDRPAFDMTAEERQALRERMRAQREAQAPIREQMRETHRKAGEEIHGILTPEQETQLRSIRRARMDELRREMRDRRGGEWRGPRGQRPARGDFFRHRRGA